MLSVTPPPQMPATLESGTISGYCVGEPWNSLAVLSKTGWCVSTSMDLAPRHPEKVLMVRKDFATKSEREHVALIAALIEACAFCDKPENRERLIETLAQSKYVNVPIQALRMGMGGVFDYGHGRQEKQSRFHIFAADAANEPSPEKAAWVIDNLLRSGLVTDPTLIPRERTGEWFRADIHQQALQLIHTTHS
jgi:ABC-type nitrate/sulfonate/bicarbonate transport system substrate-binding protein